MKTGKPLVSVVLCTHNDEKFIAETIKSVLVQTYQDFEFIIWNDGSTDNTERIIKSFNDSRIRYFFHENTGLSPALQMACNEAQGEYIARIDGDDICLPNRLEREVDFLERHSDYVLVSSAVYYIDEKNQDQGRLFPCTNSSIIKKTLIVACLIVHPMVMMRKDAYVKAGGYLNVAGIEDRIFWSRLIKQGKFGNISTPLGKYRLQRNSLSHRYNPFENVIYEFCNKLVNDEEISSSDIEMFNKLYRYSKQFEKPSNQIASIRKKSIEERLFSVLKIITGNTIAETIVTGLKNLYCSWQYRKL